MRLKKVKGEPSLARDESTGAVLCTDKAGLASYKKKKADRDRINRIESELAEIKAMLGILVRGKLGPVHPDPLAPEKLSQVGN